MRNSGSRHARSAVLIRRISAEQSGDAVSGADQCFSCAGRIVGDVSVNVGLHPHRRRRRPDGAGPARSGGSGRRAAARQRSARQGGGERSGRCLGLDHALSALPGQEETAARARRLGGVFRAGDFAHIRTRSSTDRSRGRGPATGGVLADDPVRRQRAGSTHDYVFSQPAPVIYGSATSRCRRR